MGVFDFFRKNDQRKEGKLEVLNEENFDKTINNESNIVPFYGILEIPESTRHLLWIADGKYKNYNENSDQVFEFKNQLFRISFSFKREPSLIYTNMPVEKISKFTTVKKLGYYPSYEQLDSQQKFVYLNWLSDITKPVDIGYVFIFYYGLERHLISGNYPDAVDTVLNLRQYHGNPSFNSYSANSLIMASILHQDRATLLKVLTEIGDTSYCSGLVLIGKYVMRIDLTSDEIISLSSSVGFTNKRYIKEYPDLFRKKIDSILIEMFGKSGYPIYQLKMKYSLEPIMSFANISLNNETRFPALPNILNSPELSSSLNMILKTAHDYVKQDLAEMRKKGLAPKPKSAEVNEGDQKPECPYCHNILDQIPQRKKKCPFCKEKIIVRTDPLDKKKILLRNNQLEEFEEKVIQVRTHKTIPYAIG